MFDGLRYCFLQSPRLHCLVVRVLGTADMDRMADTVAFTVRATELSTANEVATTVGNKNNVSANGGAVVTKNRNGASGTGIAIGATTAVTTNLFRRI